MPANQDQLLPDEFLDPNQSITSLDGRFTLTFLSNGILRLGMPQRHRSGRTLWWTSNTYGRPASRCIMQGDGNRVIYDLNGAPVWPVR
jgi:hypothetical protein